MESAKYHGKVEVPDWFTVGIKFKSRWVKNRIMQVISFDAVTNLLKVELSPDTDAPAYMQTFCEDGWDLRITLHAFETGEYWLV